MFQYGIYKCASVASQTVPSVSLAQGQSEVYDLASMFTPQTLLSLQCWVSDNPLILYFLVLTLWSPFEQFCSSLACFLSSLSILLLNQILPPSCYFTSRRPSWFHVFFSLLFTLLLEVPMLSFNVY